MFLQCLLQVFALLEAFHKLVNHLQFLGYADVLRAVRLTLSALYAVCSLSHAGHGTVQTDEVLSSQAAVVLVAGVGRQCTLVLAFIVVYEDGGNVDAVGTGHAVLAPPSTGFMLYAINAGIGVGKMFIAGIIPGIILTVCYAATAIVICLRDPEAGPKGEKFPMREKLKALLGVLPVLVLFIMVLGGILFGWCSATEGGAVGA